MTPDDSKPSRTAVSRLKHRIFQGWSSREENEKGEKGTQLADAAKPLLPAIAPGRPVGFPSRIAEFLLVFRLRARRRSLLTADILERTVRVVLVTCKHWFSGTDAHQPRKRD